MSLPFSADQFFQVFRLYNTSVWPAQIILYAIGATAIALALRGRRGDSRIVAAILAFLWLWMALVYHLAFFRGINPAAVLFAALFVAEALLLLWHGVWLSRLQFKFAYNHAAAIGAVLIMYAMIGYPLLGATLGQVFPAIPTFGVPCPTTIFTFGLLLWSASSIVPTIATIPILWAIVATQAALQLEVREDWGLTAAAVIVLGVLAARHRFHFSATQNAS